MPTAVIDGSDVSKRWLTKGANPPVFKSCNGDPEFQIVPHSSHPLLPSKRLLKMPVVEIAWWPASDALLADPTIVAPALDYISKVDGCLSIYSGLAEDKKTVYAFIVWETIEHHKELMKHPEYPAVLGLAPSVGGELKLNHITYVQDFVPSLTAPITEILGLTLKEGKTKEDLVNVFNNVGQIIDAANSKYAPVAWGQALEDPQKFWVTLGWDSAKAQEDFAHQPSFLPSLMEMQSIAVPSLQLVSLKKAF
ncbi:hypothetical protein GALMADRAFT_238631 [Galerina marginata CBS 339.88]|uniref:Uncharacterized protein n=1 Tax=Galerina marginata (strain CBS 339.88) TaxID=685588 RepID=A0A067TKW6_GALM3|nr:hypothetical protein GALMADRAFT_238631 [Galerina marginata CBS 339.88]